MPLSRPGRIEMLDAPVLAGQSPQPDTAAQTQLSLDEDMPVIWKLQHAQSNLCTNRCTSSEQTVLGDHNAFGAGQVSVSEFSLGPMNHQYGTCRRQVLLFDKAND